MLKTPKAKPHCSINEMLSNLQGIPNLIYSEGIIETDNLRNKYYVNEDSEELCYESGVADNIEQVIECYQSFIDRTDINICIGYFKIIKANEPESGGWRWHKWGEYIGTKNPQHEYIYDEDDSIEEVICFSVHEII